MVNLPSIIEKGITTMVRRPPISVEVNRTGVHSSITDYTVVEQIMGGIQDLCGELAQHGGPKARIKIHQKESWNIVEIYNNSNPIEPIFLKTIQSMQLNLRSEDIPEGHPSGHYRAAAYLNRVGGSCLTMNTNNPDWPVLYLVMIPMDPKLRTDLEGKL
jgi:hypothetical protein